MVYTFWTGGFDSTFRICQLSRENTVVQPIYIEDYDRPSTKQEIAAMEKITSMLADRHCPAEILPLKILKRRELTIDPAITEAYLELKKTVKLGTQYEWLAQVSKQYPGVELSAEKHIDGFGGCGATVSKFGVMAYDGRIGYVDKAQSADALNKIMGDFTFPIITYTELEMIELLHEWDYDDIIKQVWFCHTPAHGRPCGVCRPCQQKIEDKMEFLVDKAAMRRYHAFRTVKRVAGDTPADYAAKLLRKI